MEQQSLAQVLQANAVVSALSGLVAAVAAAPLADVLDVPTAAVRIVGLGLLPFAAYVGWASRARGQSLVREAQLIGAADVAWVAATVAVVAAGWLSAAGVALSLAVSLVVAGFAVLELRLASLPRQREAVQ